MQTTNASFSSAGIIWLKLAVLYLMLGVGMGVAMGASQDFPLRPVHAHINLLGWATMALAGLTYTVFPQAGRSRLAKLHFWLTNISLPGMMILLALVLTGRPQVGPILGIFEILGALAVVVFAFNLFLNLGKDK